MKEWYSSWRGVSERKLLRHKKNSCDVDVDVPFQFPFPFPILMPHSEIPIRRGRRRTCKKQQHCVRAHLSAPISRWCFDSSMPWCFLCQRSVSQLQTHRNWVPAPHMRAQWFCQDIGQERTSILEPWNSRCLLRAEIRNVFSPSLPSFLLARKSQLEAAFDLFAKYDRYWKLKVMERRQNIEIF